MRRLVLLWIVLLLVLVAGCDGESASPTTSPSPVPATSAPEPTTVVEPSGPASCELAPLEFPTNPNIPPVSDSEYIHGPEDAPITFIEYADFQ